MPTGTATATATATPTSSPTPPPFGECEGLEGAPFGLCVAYCEALECDDSSNFPLACFVLGRIFERLTGEQPPCEEPPPPASCEDFSGFDQTLCDVMCEFIEENPDAPGIRLSRVFQAFTGAPLPCV